MQVSENFKQFQFEIARERFRIWLATFGVQFKEINADSDQITWEITGGKRPVTVRLQWHFKYDYYRPIKRYDYIVQIGNLKPKRIIDPIKAAEIVARELKTIRKRKNAKDLWALEDWEQFARNLEEALKQCESGSKVHHELDRHYSKVKRYRDEVKETGKLIDVIWY